AATIFLLVGLSLIRRPPILYCLKLATRCDRWASGKALAIASSKWSPRTRSLNGNCDRKIQRRKTMIARSIYAFFVTLLILVSPAPSIAVESSCPSVLDHKFATLQEESVSLCQFRGKVLLIVNTASECGYTPQYEGLEKLYRRYRDKGFVVLGFPANDFGGQEPGSNKEIAQFCRLNYGVTFPMFTKTSVVGANANALFQELSATTGKPPRWNFHKYLLDRTGKPVAVFESAAEPDHPQATTQIPKLL